jgi:hypothetical protein
MKSAQKHTSQVTFRGRRTPFPRMEATKINFLSFFFFFYDRKKKIFLTHTSRTTPQTVNTSITNKNLTSALLNLRSQTPNTGTFTGFAPNLVHFCPFLSFRTPDLQLIIRNWCISARVQKTTGGNAQVAENGLGQKRLFFACFFSSPRSTLRRIFLMVEKKKLGLSDPKKKKVILSYTGLHRKCKGFKPFLDIYKTQVLMCISIPAAKARNRLLRALW